MFSGIATSVYYIMLQLALISVSAPKCEIEDVMATGRVTPIRYSLGRW